VVVRARAELPGKQLRQGIFLAQHQAPAAPRTALLARSDRRRSAFIGHGLQTSQTDLDDFTALS